MGGKLVIGIVAALALVLGACGVANDDADQTRVGDRSSERSETSTTSTTAPAVTADPPLAFDATQAVPLPSEALQSNLAGDVTSSFLTLHERVAYIVQPDRLVAVDVLTGEQLWDTAIEGEPSDPDAQAGAFVNDAGPRPPKVSADGKTVVAAVPVTEPGKGTTPGHEAISVLAADTSDGEPRWTAKVDVTADVTGYSPQGANTEVTAVTDQAVVVDYHNEAATSAAIDPATQQVLWQRDRYEAGVVVGDVVVGVDAGPPGSTYRYSAVALDLMTGKEVWTAAPDSDYLTLIPAYDNLVVVDHADGDGNSRLGFLDPSNGQERTGYTFDQFLGALSSAFGNCTYDERSVVLCVGSSVLNAFDATTGESLWSLPDQAANRVAPRVKTVWHGAVYGTTENGPVVLDATTGEDRSAEAGAAPSWVSEYAGIGLGDDGTPTAYAVKEP